MDNNKRAALIRKIAERPFSRQTLSLLAQQGLNLVEVRLHGDLDLYLLSDGRVLTWTDVQLVAIKSPLAESGTWDSRLGILA